MDSGSSHKGQEIEFQPLVPELLGKLEHLLSASFWDEANIQALMPRMEAAAELAAVAAAGEDIFAGGSYDAEQDFLPFVAYRLDDGACVAFFELVPNYDGRCNMEGLTILPSWGSAENVRLVAETAKERARELDQGFLYLTLPGNDAMVAPMLEAGFMMPVKSRDGEGVPAHLVAETGFIAALRAEARKDAGVSLQQQKLGQQQKPGRLLKFPQPC